MPPDSVLIDFLRDQYKEANSNHRFFGRLRMQVAWAPATVAFGVAIAIDSAANQPWAATGFLFIVLLLVFISNMYFQRKQRESYFISEYFQERIAEALPDVSCYSYGQAGRYLFGGSDDKRHTRGLSAKQRAATSPRLDKSSTMLATFYIFLVLTQAALAFFGNVTVPVSQDLQQDSQLERDGIPSGQ